VNGLFVTFKTANQTFRFGKAESNNLKTTLIDLILDPNQKYNIKELDGVTCKIDMLSNFKEINDYTDWEIGTHGIRITYITQEMQSMSSADYAMPGLNPQYKPLENSQTAIILPSEPKEQEWTKRETILHLLKEGGIVNDLKEDDSETDFKNNVIFKYLKIESFTTMVISKKYNQEFNSLRTSEQIVQGFIENYLNRVEYLCYSDLKERIVNSSNIKIPLRESSLLLYIIKPPFTKRKNKYQIEKLYRVIYVLKGLFNNYHKLKLDFNVVNDSHLIIEKHNISMTYTEIGYINENVKFENEASFVGLLNNFLVEDIEKRKYLYIWKRKNDGTVVGFHRILVLNNNTFFDKISIDDKGYIDFFYEMTPNKIDVYIDEMKVPGKSAYYLKNNFLKRSGGDGWKFNYRQGFHQDENLLFQWGKSNLPIVNTGKYMVCIDNLSLRVLVKMMNFDGFCNKSQTIVKIPIANRYALLFIKQVDSQNKKFGELIPTLTNKVKVSVPIYSFLGWVINTRGIFKRKKDLSILDIDDNVIQSKTQIDNGMFFVNGEYMNICTKVKVYIIDEYYNTFTIKQEGVIGDIKNFEV